MNKLLLYVLFLGISLQMVAQVQLQSSFIPGNKEVNCVQYHPEGRYLAMGSDSKYIDLYKMPGGEHVKKFGKTGDRPSALAFSSNGSLLAVGDQDGGIIIWNTNNEKQVCKVEVIKKRITGLEFTRDGKFLISSSGENIIYMWHAESGALYKKLEGHRDAITSISISPDGKWLVSGGYDKQLIIWDLEKGLPHMRFQAHKLTIRKVKFSPEGSMVVSSGDDRQIQLWDARTGENLNTFRIYTGKVSDLVFSSDGRYIITGGSEGQLAVINVKTGRIEFKSDKTGGEIALLAFNPTEGQCAAYIRDVKQLQVYKFNMEVTTSTINNSNNLAAKKSGFAPKISWDNIQDGIVRKASMKVSANIICESNLRDIRLFVNGHVVDHLNRSDVMLETSESNITPYSGMAILEVGKNKIWIEATSIVGTGTSDVLVLDYQPEVESIAEWISPVGNITDVYSSRFQVVAKIMGAEQSQEVSIELNGKSGSRILFPREGGAFNQFVTLMPGENKIRIKCSTHSGDKYSSELTLNYVQVCVPEIKWILPSSDTASYVASNKLMAQIKSGSEIERLEIIVNGLSVYFKNNTGKKVILLEQNIQLSAGINKILISAQNSTGKGTSVVRTIQLLKTENTSISWINPAQSTVQVYKPFYSFAACIQGNEELAKVELYNGKQLIRAVDNPVLKKGGECGLSITDSINLGNGPVILQIVAYGSDKIYQSEVRKIEYIKPEPPVINWQNTYGFNSVTDAEVCRVKACISSQTPIETICLKVNQTIIRQWDAPGMDSGDCQVSIDEIINLNQGETLVQIEAANKGSKQISQQLKITRQHSNPYRFALIIGNQDYSSYQVELQKESDVAYAINDARAFRDAAISHLGVPADNIMYYENARYIDMRKAIKKLMGIMEITNGKSEIYVYYAGHGFPDELTREPFLIPVDGSGSDLEFSAIKLSYLFESLTQFSSQRVTVFLDACFSGAARNQGIVASRGVRIVPRKEEQAVKKNLVVFSASSEDQAALAYSEKEHGLFTFYLLRKLEYTKGKVSYGVLAEYLTEEVAIRSVMVNGMRQVPQTNASHDVDSEWKAWKFVD